VAAITRELPKSSLIGAIARYREGSIGIFILLLVILVSLRSPIFLSLENFRDILLNISILAIVALAQAMVIITRGIDLSVSSMVGLVAMMVSFQVKGRNYQPGSGVLGITWEPSWEASMG
jgi:rhamnose transport system permease protein